MLKTKFENVSTQHRDHRYPFACDFYIPLLDLFIEYQGTWTHGGHRFDQNSKRDQDTVSTWKAKANEINFKGNSKKFYLNAIYTWTVLDVKKREIAKRNRLNFIEFFSFDQFLKWFERQ